MENWIKNQLNIIKEDSDFNKFNVKNSMDLINRLKHNYSIGDWGLLTLDVVDMYGTIPRERIFEIVKAKVENVKLADPICKLLKISFDNNYFVAMGKAYSQIKALPMGNCLSGIIAGLIMLEFVIEFLCVNRQRQNTL